MYSNCVPALHPNFDRIVLDVTREKADRMVARGQARWIRGKRVLRLAEWYELPENGGRTRTARPGWLAAMGRSQVYTTADPQRGVHGHKRIFPEDLHVFRQATLDCIAVKS